MAIEVVRTGDGVAIPVAVRGTHREDRPSIVLVHGITDSWRSFEGVIELLPDDVHVLAPTLRGHGAADPPGSGYTPDELAADVATVLVRMDVGSAVVVGHSLGAVVACRLTATRPDLIAELVLAGGFAQPARNDAIRELVDFAAELADPIERAVVAEFQHGTVRRPVPAGRMDVFVDESLQVPARVWRAAARGLAAADVLDELDGSTAPALLVWGVDDPFTSVDEQVRLAGAFADATIRPYPATGHAVHWEQPERFRDDLVAWFERCSR